MAKPDCWHCNGIDDQQLLLDLTVMHTLYGHAEACRWQYFVSVSCSCMIYVQHTQPINMNVIMCLVIGQCKRLFKGSGSLLRWGKRLLGGTDSANCMVRHFSQ